MDPYAILKMLQDSGHFDRLRASVFDHPLVQSQFETIQQRLISELSASPLLDVPHKLRQSKQPQIFNSFRLAVRNTSIAHDIHSVLWIAIQEMAHEIYSAIQDVTSQSQTYNQVTNKDIAVNIPADHDSLERFTLVGKSEANNTDATHQHAVSSSNPDIPQDATVKDDCAADKFGIDEAPNGVISVCATPAQEAAIDSEEAVKPFESDSVAKKAGKGKKRGRLIKMENIEEQAADRLESHEKHADIEEINARPAKSRQASSASLSDPFEPVKKRVKIWWPLDKCWYKGMVTAYRNRDRKHHIRYDDDEVEWLDLTKEKWKYQ